MITVLHGTDTISSYNRLSQVLALYKAYRKTYFDKETSEEELNMAFMSRDLFDDKKVIVIKNLLKQNKNLPNHLETAPDGLEIVLWESDELTPKIISKLSRISKIENFKLPAKIFYFLDSLAPGKSKLISELKKLGDEPSLVWNLQNRLLLLILAKLNIGSTPAGKITRRSLAPWQWSKICSQAEKFTINELKSIYNASLKIDYLIKSGQTSLSPTTLLSVMLIKYL